MIRRFFELIIQGFLRLIFNIRYRVTVKGLENITPEKLKKPGGVLILPNHPAILVDPFLVALYSWRRFRPRPVIVEYMYYTPGIRWLMDLIQALPIPNFSSVSNSLKKRRGEKTLNNIIEALQQGDNVILYPAGKTKRSGYEDLGGASGLHQVFQKVDDLNIVLIRTTGLWGSSFSRAVTGKPAQLYPVLKKGIIYTLKNLLFLNPKREVMIEFALADDTFPAHGTKMEVNQWLEEWYNRPFGTPEGEPLSLVSYSYWNPEKPKVIYKGRHHLIDHRDVSDIPVEVKDDLIKEIAKLSHRSIEEISEDMVLSSDLGLDSLDVANIIAYLSENYGINKGLTTEELSTVSQIIAIAARGKYKKSEGEAVDNPAPKQWLSDHRKGRISVAEGETIIEAFLSQTAKNPKGILIGSDQSGVVTCRKSRITVLLLAKKFAELPGKYVGLMLPATAAFELTALALMLAGKVPVMINWTQGSRHLESVVASSGISVCLTSWAFIEKLEGTEFGPLDDMCLMLEESKKEFSFFDKMRAVAQSFYSTDKILHCFKAETLSGEDHAVVLFTSGTEAEPKGVPLTHNNILSNLRSAIQVLTLDYSDKLLSILPPFHSFGFTVTGMLPMVTGMPVVVYPDPTDGQAIAQTIQRWQATVIAGAPSFLQGILQAATPKMLKTVHIVVSGAEKAPLALLEYANRVVPSANIVEGYGITECSPILSVNLDARTPSGVGKPVPGVRFLLVHPETHEKIPQGERGLLLCQGPNVFHGYLKGTERDPFITIDDEKWYNTGDLGYLDEQNNMILSGRLKRFTKIGGEMVSLGAIEEVILNAAVEQKWPLQFDGPSLAVLSNEEGRKTLLTLCATFSVTVRQINNALNSAGFSNIIRISEVKQVEKIPLMGTGKINYRALEKIIKS